MQDNILPQWTMDILLVVTGDHRGTLFISTNHSHLLFRRKQNVQDILLKRVEDISKQYLLMLYIIARYVHTCNFDYMIIKQHLRLFFKLCL